AAIEIGANLFGSATAIPDAIFGEQAGGALGRTHAADLEMVEGVFERLAFDGVGFAIDVNAKLAVRVARHGDVGPQIWCHFAFGDDAVTGLWAAINAETAFGEIE